MTSEELLKSWNDAATTRAITDFVARVTTDGPDFVPPEDRVATFDNDGTLWCEKPIPIQLAFILTRLAAVAQADASLRDRQPWKASYEHDYAWLSGVMTKHYAGDDSDVKVLMGGILGAFAGTRVEEYEAQAVDFVRTDAAPHARSRLPGLRLPADGRAASLPRGQRLHHIHRLGRRP